MKARESQLFLCPLGMSIKRVNNLSATNNGCHKVEIGEEKMVLVIFFYRNGGMVSMNGGTKLPKSERVLYQLLRTFFWFPVFLAFPHKLSHKMWFLI